MAQENRLLEQFDQAMLDLCEKSLQLTPPYPARVLRRMTVEHGGKAAADRLLVVGPPSAGFGELLTRGKENLKLSVEYLVLQNPWRQLFNPEQLAEARRRLVEVECELPPEDVQAAAEDQPLAEEVPTGLTLSEGAVRQVTINAYERSPIARELCIKHYGTVCSICGFDFGTVYGPIAKGFIHIHHIRKISELRAEYTVDPIADLRPVCPNCHAVIHLGGESRPIEEVKRLLTMQAQR